MPRKSTIKTLPDALLKEVNRLLADAGWSIDQVTRYLADAGHPRSRSAVGRHAKRLNVVADKLRQSREMAAALVREIGPGAVEGKTGRLLVEILQKLVFDHLLGKVEGDDAGGGLESEDFFLMARSIQQLAAAQKIDVDREMKIRRETAEKAAKVATGAAKKAGLSKDTIAAIERDVLGIVR